MPFYAVAKGINPGIYNTWDECKKQVAGYSGAIYKKFDSNNEAEQYIIAYNPVNNDSLPNINNYTPEYYVYTDGSCLNNGTTNAKSGIGIYFGENDNRNVSCELDNKYKQTNNVAELVAIIRAIHIIKDDLQNKCICIVSDSEYAIKCATTYGKTCSLNKWTKDIPNLEIVKELYELVEKHPNVRFMHIMAHTTNQDIHSIGNRHADNLANMGALNSNINTLQENTLNKTIIDVCEALQNIQNKLMNFV